MKDSNLNFFKQWQVNVLWEVFHNISCREVYVYDSELSTTQQIKKGRYMYLIAHEMKSKKSETLVFALQQSSPALARCNERKCFVKAFKNAYVEYKIEEIKGEGNIDRKKKLDKFCSNSVYSLLRFVVWSVEPS